MEFLCENPGAEYACDRIWKGHVDLVRCRDGTIEMNVFGKGSAMHVILGGYEYGTYLCIPDWGIGRPLSRLDDIFWNQEQLERRIGRVDSITLSEALKVISKELEDAG